MYIIYFHSSLAINFETFLEDFFYWGGFLVGTVSTRQRLKCPELIIVEKNSGI